MRSLSVWLILTTMMIACALSGKKDPVRSVQYFDLTFYGDWTGSWSIKADSSGHFAYRSRQDSFYTGVFPDSLRDSIYSILIRLKNDSLCTSTQEPCDDCAAVYLKMKEGKDSFELIQSSAICDQIQSLLNRLENNRSWLGTGRQDTMIDFLTTKKILPLPPRIDHR